jgi:hypothetical protein
MAAEEEATRLLRALEDDGYELGECCVVPQGVFFRSKQLARVFSQKYSKDLVPIEQPITGWLAKNRA